MHDEQLGQRGEKGQSHLWMKLVALKKICLEELTFEWNPEIWEKGGEALLGAVGPRPEGWQMMVSTGSYMQSHETGTQLPECSEGNVSSFEGPQIGTQKRDVQKITSDLFTDEKRKVQKGD